MAVYAVSDLHGRMDLYNKICKFLKPEDKVICLGDCGDRGPQSWELIKAVYENPQWEYLMGNHEHMLIHAMDLYLFSTPSNWYINPIQSLYENGGKSTFEAWLNESPQDLSKWRTRLARLPKRKDYFNKDNKQIILTHSGFTPDLDEESDTVFSYLWNRDHLKDTRWQEEDTSIIVHGHTPIQTLGNKETKVLWYCNNHKVNIDLGSVWSDITVLLDLDTFEEHYIAIKGE